MNNESERAAFEKHFSQPPFEWSFGRQGENHAWPGQYITYYVETAWEGWQARAQLIAEQEKAEAVTKRKPVAKEIIERSLDPKNAQIEPQR